MKRVWIILLAALMLLGAGCARQEPDPASSVPGYYGQGQSLDGGSKSQKNFNLAQIAVQRRQEDVVLTLSFYEGATADNPGAALCKALPAYRIEALTAPSRIVVHLPEGLFEFLGQDLERMGEFQGLVTEREDKGMALYFQFSGAVAYKVDQEEGKLKLSVRADDAASVEQYHVKLPYKEENAGIAAKNAMRPTLCDDFASAYYLTEGMAALDEADARCQAINEELEAAGSDDTAEVIQLSSGEAPAFAEPISRSLLTMMGALKTEDDVIDGRLVAVDARFLCRNDDGGMIMARPQVELTGDGATETFEEVWVYHQDGKRERLMDTAFSSVQKAVCSRDGRYIALLEQSDGARLLYLYDRRDGGLLFLSAEGMGDYTADLSWGGDGVLYAMCGDDSMQLMAYEPRLAEMGEEPLRAVEEREGGYGNVGAAGGVVYFNDEYGNIYAVDAQSGSRELFDVGDGFLLSPDGSKIVLIVYEDGENTSRATLVLCDLKSGERVQIAADTSLSDYVWSGDSKALFYLTANEDATDAKDYPVCLMRYSLADGKTTQLGALASNSIFQGNTQESVILMFYQNRNGVFYPITYELNLSELTSHQNDELIITVEDE